MAMEFEIQKSDGTAVTSRNMGVISAGITVIASDLAIKNISDSAFDDLRLSAVLARRHFQSGGSDTDGAEVVAEKWVEASVDGGAWTAIGGDPSVSGNYLPVPKPVVSAARTLALRLNVPAGAETFGDFSFMVDLFFRTA